MVSDGVVGNPHSKAEGIQGLDGHRDSDTGAAIKPCNKIHFLVDSTLAFGNYTFVFT